MPKKIGFIGLGIMGSGMSRNILKGDFDLMVYNRTREKTDALAEAGAEVADSPRQMAEWADTSVLMLTGPEAVDAVLFGDEGLLTGTAAPDLLINMSTVSPAYARQLDRRLREKSIAFIDAPVAGTREPAEEGSLVVFAGGPEEAIAKAEDLLMTMAKKIVPCGDAGMGSSLKMVFNLLLGSMLEGLCEAVNLGERLGFSKEFLLNTVQAGPLGCGLFGYKKDKLISGEYPVQFPLKHMTKDIRFALQAADEAGAAAPLGQLLFQIYRQGVGQGWGDADFAAVQQVIEAMSDRGKA